MSYNFDAALELQSATTVTASTKVSGTGVALNVLSVGPTFRAVFNVGSASAFSSAQVATLGVEAAASTSFASPVTISLPGVTAAGVYELPLSSKLFDQFTAGDLRYIRSWVDNAPGTGTSSITYSAFLAH
ncbi:MULTISPECIES: hypothetical protein [unclassified Inquilinus]|uniref:hypothetical protein n=1 Tax=unclassified Inquilinus TaxID=2645927 RepID=UPI003F8DDF54